MAPSPKPPGARSRRHLGQSQWRQLSSAGRVGFPPPLPAKKPAWLKATIDWWATIWASPMAIVWLEADVEPLLRLARLKDSEARGTMPATGYVAMQQLEDRFGLSPKARRALQWEISQADSEEPERALAPVRKLRAVSA